MLRYAVIGTSWISQAYVKAASRAGGATLAAVYSRNAALGLQFAEETRAERIITSLTELADATDIDAVYIASPNSLHYSQSRLMLESGKHVICEKPAASSPEQIRELIEISEKYGLIYMEAIMFLYLPELWLLKNAIQKIGHITSANLDFSQLSSKYAALKRGELPNIFNPDFHTGCLMDIGVYNIYMAVELFGQPDKIISSARFLPTGADGSGTAIFDYKDKQITLTYSKTGQSHAPSQIFGDEGTILIDSISQLQNIKIKYNDGSTEQICGECSRTSIMSCEAARFRDCIEGKYRDELDYAHRLSYVVNKIMYEIRNQNPEFRF